MEEPAKPQHALHVRLRWRQRELNAAGELWPEEAFFTGIGLVRRGIGACITGSYEQVARKFQAYTEMGLSYFILSGYPHREETARAGETWLARYRAKQLAR